MVFYIVQLYKIKIRINTVEYGKFCLKCDFFCILAIQWISQNWTRAVVPCFQCFFWIREMTRHHQAAMPRRDDIIRLPDLSPRWLEERLPRYPCGGAQQQVRPRVPMPLGRVQNGLQMQMQELSDFQPRVIN